MRGSVVALDNWLDPNHRVPALVYLDATDWEGFCRWLEQDRRRVLKLHDGTWRVRLFKSLVSRHYGPSGHRTRRLRVLGIELSGAKPRAADELFVGEVLRMYFHGDPSARSQAELLALARRESAGEHVTLISQHQGFWRVPLVNVYFLNAGALRGRSDLPAQFDPLVDLRIHRVLARAVLNRIDQPPYGAALFEGIIALRDHVRYLTGLSQDGHNLMQAAFKQDGSRLRLNPLTDPSTGGSQQNEQRGYREMYCGLMTGIRNPLAHEGPGSLYAEERYPDKAALVKYLCLLSILCERADPPLPC